MAPSLQYFVLLSILLLLLPLNTTSSSHHHHHHHHRHHGLKSLHFSLFQHETINRTGYIIVTGITGPGAPVVSQTTTPFGTLFAFQDPMTLKPNRTSKVVATCQGTSVTSGLDGLESISIASINLNLKKYKGTISIVGLTHNVKPANHPIVGGTGDFLFAQGYVTSSPVDLVGITVTYKIEFHVYWPPYATPKASS